MSDNPCADCGGRCCSYQLMTIGYHNLKEGQRYDSSLLDSDRLDGLLLDTGEVADMEWVVVTKPDGGRYLAFHCNHLEDGRCTVYEDRPEMCRSFECSVLEGEVDLEEFVEEDGLDGDLPEGADERDVTDRVLEILVRDTDADGVADA